ncbi:MAG: hypothetical protein IBX61_09945 [Thermoleophilia bacterium]|nr:hypothetical protein [Thermoleophilia bacterium]
MTINPYPPFAGHICLKETVRKRPQNVNRCWDEDQGIRVTQRGKSFAEGVGIEPVNDAGV